MMFIEFHALNRASGNKLANILPVVGVCLLIALFAGIAITVILALIPVYLKTRDVTVYQPSAGISFIFFSLNSISIFHF